MTVRHFCEEGMFVREVRPRNEGPGEPASNQLLFYG